jgi:signal transduction histidine kinase
VSLASLWRFKRRVLLLVAAATVLTVVSAVYFVRFLAKPNTGLVVNYPEVVNQDGRIVFSPKTPFSPAVASGLLPDRDEILSVDGTMVRSIRDVVETNGRIWGFQPFPVEVLRNGEQRTTVWITPVFNLTRLDWVFALVFCTALGFTALYLFLRLPADTASNLIGLASLFYLVFTAVKPFYYESLLSNLLIHLGKLTSWFMVFFALYFPTPRGSRALRRGVIGGILAAYALFITVRLLLFARWAAGAGDLWLDRYRILGKLGNVADGVAFVVYLLLLVRSYLRSPQVLEKRRLEWILAGFLIAIPPYFFVDQLPLILGGPEGLRVSLGNFANLFLVFVPLFFIVGLLKHNTFNLKFFVSRYVVYAVLALLVFSFFTGLYDPVRRLFVRSYGVPEPMAGFLVTAVLFVVLIPLRSLVCGAADRVFYHKFYSRSVRYSVSLEKRNFELKLIIDELTRQNMRTFQKDKMREMRGIVTGIATRLGDPVSSIGGSLSNLGRKIEGLFKVLEAGGGAAFEDLQSLHDQLQRLLQDAQSGDLAIRDFVRKLITLTGSRSSVPVRVETGKLLRSLQAEVRKSLADWPLRLEGDCAVGVLCNPEEVLQALYHVVQNAAESGITPQDSVAVRCDSADGLVRLRVEDRGTGMDESDLRRAYDPFFTTKTGHDGLGLYFARMLVERNNGSLELRSRPGRGTTATILLAEDALPEETPAARRGAP